MENKRKKAEERVKEISIGVSGALLVASFTVLNESINFQISSETPNIISIGYCIVGLLTPFLAFDIYLLFFHQPDNITTTTEKNSLTLRILVWFFTIIGLLFILGGKKVCVNQNEFSLIWVSLVGLGLAYLYFRYSKKDN